MGNKKTVPICGSTIWEFMITKEITHRCVKIIDESYAHLDGTERHMCYCGKRFDQPKREG